MSRKELCPICGKAMRRFEDHNICVNCNDRYGDYYNFFACVRNFWIKADSHVSSPNIETAPATP